MQPASEPADPATKAISSDRRLTPSSRPVSQATSTVTGSISNHISMKSPTGYHGVIIACTCTILAPPRPPKRQCAVDLAGPVCCQAHHPRRAVDGHGLTVAEAAGRVACGEHRG